MDFVKVCSVRDIDKGKGKVVEVNGKQIAVMNDNGNFFAVENECKHHGGPLGEGTCESGIVTCPWHQWTYDLITGKNKMDESIKLETYELKVEGKDIFIKI